MLEELISDWFHKMEWTWKLKGGKVIVPSEQDVLDALDEAAKQLHSQPLGTQLHVGRLVVEKKHTGHRVYVYVGDYL